MPRLPVRAHRSFCKSKIEKPRRAEIGSARGAAASDGADLLLELEAHESPCWQAKPEIKCWPIVENACP
jgi:hypothetical protein